MPISEKTSLNRYIDELRENGAEIKEESEPVLALIGLHALKALISMYEAKAETEFKASEKKIKLPFPVRSARTLTNESNDYKMKVVFEKGKGLVKISAKLLSAH